MRCGAKPQALLVLWLVLMLAACASERHAVRCSGPLQPINSPSAGHPSPQVVP